MKKTTTKKKMVTKRATLADMNEEKAEVNTRYLYKTIQAKPNPEATEELLCHFGNLGWKVICSYCTGYFVLEKAYKFQ